MNLIIVQRELISWDEPFYTSVFSLLLIHSSVYMSINPFTHPSTYIVVSNFRDMCPDRIIHIIKLIFEMTSFVQWVWLYYQNIEYLLGCKRSLDTKNIKLFSTYFKTSYIHTWTTVMVAVSFGVRDEGRQPRRTA